MAANSGATPLIGTNDQYWLSKQLRMQRKMVHAAMAGSGALYNTINHYSLLSEDTLTLDADTYHSVSFSVIKGSVSVTVDGGVTSVTYPVGSNVNWEVGALITNEISFTVAGTSGDGLNEVQIQTVN
jgi:hypothetical protein